MLSQVHHSDTHALGCTLAQAQSHGCRQTSHCANKLKRGQSALAVLISVSQQFALFVVTHKDGARMHKATVYYIQHRNTVFIITLILPSLWLQKRIMGIPSTEQHLCIIILLEGEKIHINNRCTIYDDTVSDCKV